MDEIIQLVPAIKKSVLPEPLLLWGLDFIRAVQSQANPLLTFFMKAITHFGSAAVYLLLLSFIYWCIDEKKALRLSAALLFSVWINLALKFLLDQPRPFFAGYDPSLGMIPESLGGLPSGHAQNALVLWMIIASWFKKKSLYAAAAILCLLTGFSRIYLGVHFPTDIAGGWILGGMILGVYFCVMRFFDRQTTDGKSSQLEKFFGMGDGRAGIFCAAAAAFVMILYRPAGEILAPAAMLLGMAFGFNLNRRLVGFKSTCGSGKGAAKTAVLFARFVLGAAGIVLIAAIFECFLRLAFFAHYYFLIYFLRFFCAALWVFAGAPRIFVLCRLAQANPVHTKGE
jgi:membrane-associated phospholipid phosphatase